MAPSLPSGIPGRKATARVRMELEAGEASVLLGLARRGDAILPALADETAVYDLDHDMMDAERPEAMIQGGQTDRAPLAFRHGPTLDDCFSILQGAGR